MDEKIADAIALAQFSNLETSEVENFRNGIAPDFWPAIVWNQRAYISHLSAPPGKYLWQQFQHGIRQLWVDGFPAEESLKLIVEFVDSLPLLSDGRPNTSWPEERQRVENISPEQFDEYVEEAARAASNTPLKPTAGGLWPFQLGILFLMMHAQRAVFCPRCGDRFIKLDKNKKYCSRACARKARLESKLGWWNKKGQKARSKKTSARATKKTAKKGRGK
jgi:hypothetical protein